MNIPYDTITPEHFLPHRTKRRSTSRRCSIKSIQTSQKKRKRKHTNTSHTKLNPSFQDVVLNALQGIQAPLKHYAGYLRFMPAPAGLHYYRTLTDWIETIKQSRIHSVLFPFTRAENNAIEHHFRSQQILRRFMERCSRKQILKTIEAKEHDPCDLYTTETIPSHSMVTVYDIPNRTKYTFHTHTAIKMIRTSLQYSSYGIASPTAPKNPYTNVPWTVWEMLTIVKQITLNLLRNHQFPPKLLQEFRHSKYCHKTFYADNRKMLNILAAETFFGQKDDAYRNVIYEEIIDDQYKLLHLRPRCTALIMSRTKLPASLKQEWDAIALASFLDTNLNIFTDAYKTSEDIVETFKDLHERTLKYRRSVRAALTSAEDNADTNWLQSIVIDE